jgi:hypothetical protein
VILISQIHCYHAYNSQQANGHVIALGYSGASRHEIHFADMNGLSLLGLSKLLHHADLLLKVMVLRITWYDMHNQGLQLHELNYLGRRRCDRSSSLLSQRRSVFHNRVVVEYQGTVDGITLR